MNIYEIGATILCIVFICGMVFMEFRRRYKEEQRYYESLKKEHDDSVFGLIEKGKKK